MSHVHAPNARSPVKLPVTGKMGARREIKDYARSILDAAAEAERASSDA